MLKTMPKVVKALCLLVLIVVIAMIGQTLLSSALLNCSKKVADIICNFTTTPSLLLQEKTYTVLVRVYFALCVVMYCFIIWVIKTLVGSIWARRLARVGLENSRGETPHLRSVKKHKNKILAHKGWIVYRFVSLGLSDEDFTRRSGRLSGIFRGRIWKCRFTDNMKYIEVEVLPWRKVVPIVFQLLNSPEDHKRLEDMLGFASLIVGAPNGGKTYCLLTLAANYAGIDAGEKYTLIWLNRKGADVDEFRECTNYFEADEVLAGWKIVFERLRRRERHEENEAERKQKFLLVFDEYQSYVARLGSKEKTAFLQEFMSYIAMSRSLGFKTLIGSQSAYSEDMPKARDLFHNIIAMGNLPKIQKAMYFEADIVEQLAPVRHQGGGNIYHAADNSVEKVNVAPMSDEAAVMRLIADALNKPIFLPQSDKDGIQAI
jgi:hypothetical protein